MSDVEADSSSTGAVPLGSLPLDNKLASVAVGVARNLPSVLVLLNLAALFRLYSRGEVFGRANAMRLRDVGLWLVVGETMPFVCHALLSMTPYEVDKRWLHLGSFQEVILGVLVFVIASVMQVGREIEEERGQFV